MPATHKIQITLNEATGTVTAVHRCMTERGKLKIGHALDVDVDNDEVRAFLKRCIDVNRELVEEQTEVLADAHASAVADKKKPHVKPLKIGGTLGPVGGSAVKKAE